MLSHPWPHSVIVVICTHGLFPHDIAYFEFHDDEVQRALSVRRVLRKKIFHEGRNSWGLRTKKGVNPRDYALIVLISLKSRPI